MRDGSFNPSSLNPNSQERHFAESERFLPGPGLAGTILAWLSLLFFGFTASVTVRQALAELRSGSTAISPAEAIRSNPRSSAAWIELGLAAEKAGEWNGAKEDLLRAAQVDHQYLPAWTLANFYFRHPDLAGADHAGFWTWSARAGNLAYDDRQPLLRLCDAMDPDPDGVLDRLARRPPESFRAAESHPRDDEAVRQAYLDFLIGQNRFDAAQAVARRMSADLRVGDRARLDGFIERQIGAGNTTAALEIWNRLHQPPRLDRSPVERPAENDLAGIVNGDLETAPSGTGFDWRLHPTDGLGEEWRPWRLQFAFSGTESETCVLLEQALAVEGPPSDPAQLAGPARDGARKSSERGFNRNAPVRYRLSFEYATPGFPSATGLRWMIEEQGVTNGNALHAIKESPAIPPSENWHAGEWIFSPLPSGRNVWLRLVYRREAGTTRAEGRFDLRHISLEAL